MVFEQVFVLELTLLLEPFDLIVGLVGVHPLSTNNLDDVHVDVLVLVLCFHLGEVHERSCVWTDIGVGVPVTRGWSWQVFV